MFQHHRCCGFNSPGLPNDSAGYPELAYVVRGTTPSVLRFLSVIRHESPRYNHAFSKKAQHLQRWISLRMLTQGRLVPRQPWAIKRTTPTALHRKGIFIAKYIHGNINIISTALRHYNIHNVKNIHWNIDITSPLLYRYNIHNGWCIHSNIDIKSTALHHEGIYIAKYIYENISTKHTALRGCNIHNRKHIHR